MANEYEMAKQNTILLTRTGSHLYGLNTVNSDEDYVGIFVEPIEYLLSPFKTIEEVDCSFRSKLDSGKNAPDAVDDKRYALKKFIKLASQCNPNIIELLFVDPECTLELNWAGAMLLDNRHLFLSQQIAQRFIAYAISQEKKMYIRSGNIMDLVKAQEVLSIEPEYMMPIIECATFQNAGFQWDHGKYVAQIGDIQMPLGSTVKNALAIISDRIKRAGSRKDNVFERGYDYKFASHLIRLLLEGKELLETGSLELPLNVKHRDLILPIKQGQCEVREVEILAERLKAEYRSVEQSCILPVYPRIKEIEKLCIEIQKKTYDQI